MGQNNTEKETSALSKAFNITLKVIAFPATLITGWFSGDVFMRNNVYKNFAKQGYFDGRIPSGNGAQGKYSKEFRKIVAEKYAEKIEKATDPAVRERFVKNAAKFHVFDDMPHLRNQFNIPAASSVIEGAEAAAEQALKKGDAPNRIAKLINHYRSDVADFFQDIDMVGMKNYAKGTTRNQKVEATVFAITAAGIMLGALFTLNSRSVQDKIDRLVERSNNGDEKSR